MNNIEIDEQSPNKDEQQAQALLREEGVATTQPASRGLEVRLFPSQVSNSSIFL